MKFNMTLTKDIAIWLTGVHSQLKAFTWPKYDATAVICRRADHCKQSQGHATAVRSRVLLTSEQK